jgi:hypothetical protein
MADEPSSYDFAKDVGLEQEQPQVAVVGDEDIRVLLDGVHEQTPEEETETETIEFEGDLKGKTPKEISKMFSDMQATTTAAAVAGGVSQGELQAMQQQITQMQTQQTGQSTAPTPPPATGPTDEELDEEYANNPVVASRKIAQLEAEKAAMKYGPLLEGTAAQLQETQIQLRESNDPTFKKYKKEIETGLAEMPANSRFHKDALEFVYNRVLGQNVQDIVKDQLDAERAKQKEAETVETAPSTHSETGSTAPRSRSGGKARTVRNMGVSNVDYARHIKKVL